jgi:hypothetical protein
MMGILNRIESSGTLPMMQKPRSEKTRYDVILSSAIEDDFVQEMERRVPGFHYTKLTNVTGRGYSVPKLGDAVWPQLNSVFVLYCNWQEGAAVLSVVQELRRRYVGEGLACWRSAATEL